MAFPKAERGTKVSWIGGDIEIVSRAVHVSIPEDKAQDLKTLTDEIEADNVVAVRKLRTYAGKANSLASRSM